LCRWCNCNRLGLISCTFPPWTAYCIECHWRLLECPLSAVPRLHLHLDVQVGCIVPRFHSQKNFIRGFDRLGEISCGGEEYRYLDPYLRFLNSDYIVLSWPPNRSLENHEFFDKRSPLGRILELR
jgi:hypothetical protein